MTIWQKKSRMKFNLHPAFIILNEISFNYLFKHFIKFIN
jgi:hypothetical protein